MTADMQQSLEHKLNLAVRRVGVLGNKLEEFGYDSGMFFCFVVCLTHCFNIPWLTCVCFGWDSYIARGC